MGAVVSKLGEKGITINKPDESKVDEIIKSLENAPSKGLIEIWKNIPEGYLQKNWSVSFRAPGTIFEFNEDSECDTFNGFKELEGKKGYYIGQLYADTDSRVLIFEMIDGDRKGEVISCPFSDINFYYSGKAAEDFINEASKLSFDEIDDDQDTLFSQFFTKHA